jgi:probable DNA metabolism protein
MDVVVKNFKEFRIKARDFIGHDIKPRDIFWRDQGTSDHLFSLEDQLMTEIPQNKINALNVPKDFITLGQTVECHRSDKQWAHLYNLLYKIRLHGSNVLKISVDDDVYALQIMAKQIKRDIHKMHAFVRFRKHINSAGEEVFVAWHEPDHRILKKATAFFMRRFGNMNWVIATPDGVAFWDKKKLVFQETPTKREEFALNSDDFELYWLTYYERIFNPARVKTKAMKIEMPTRYWKNLPEAKIIPRMLAQASDRVDKMHKKLEQAESLDTLNFIPELKPEENPEEKLAKLKTAAQSCHGCPLFKEATQVVFGDGPSTASVLVVGEQPGNDEDLKGLPFVGPAGKLLKSILADLEIDSRSVYITNAVKHFHFTDRDGFRLHKKPQVQHIRACNPWLEREIEAVKPKVIVCLGASATQAVVGYPVSITKGRGKFFKTRFSAQALVTYHPSYLLRVKGPEREELMQNFKADLFEVKNFLR